MPRIAKTLVLEVSPCRTDTMLLDYQAKKKNGTIYYRSSFTYRLKHISLGSFSSAREANKAYEEANLLIHSSSTIEEYNARKCTLSFNKWVCIINFRDNGVYIKTPIYMKHTYFLYYLTKYEIYTFDVDDLFYYSHHTIMKRGNHLFVADYGMQVTIFSRYGIKNYAVEGRDYQFVNGDHRDYRYSNILIINRYIGVSRITQPLDDLFIAKIHINEIGRASCRERVSPPV